MGYKKFQLNRKNRYQMLQAEYLAALLLSSAEGEVGGPFAIGSEILTDDWDDIALFSLDGGKVTTRHWQIKCQRTDFGKEDFKKMIEKAHDLFNEDNSRTFHLALPNINLEWNRGAARKGSLKLAHLEELRALCVGTTDSYLLAEEAYTNNTLSEYLRPWVEEIKDLGSDLRLLTRLEVNSLGSHDEIKARTEALLNAYFQNSRLARLSVGAALEACSSLDRLQFHHLAEHLGELPRVMGFPPWTSFRRDQGNWWQRGSTRGSTDRTIAHLWAPQAGSAQLRLLSRFDRNIPLCPSLVRLALHARQGVSLSCVDRDSWRRHAESATGGTLGVSLNGRLDAVFPEGCGRALPPDHPPPPAAPDAGTLKAQLDEAMHAETLRWIEAHMDNDLSALDPDIAAGWQALIDTLRPPDRASRLHTLCYLDSEPSAVSGEVRCGPFLAVQLKQTLQIIAALQIVYPGRCDDAPGPGMRLCGLPASATALQTCATEDSSDPIEISEALGAHVFNGGVLIVGGAYTSYEEIVPPARRPSMIASGDAPFNSDPPEPGVLFAWGKPFRDAWRGGGAMLTQWTEACVGRAGQQQREAIERSLNAIRDEEDADAA